MTNYWALSKEVELALNILQAMYIHKDKTYWSSGAVAECLGESQLFVYKIMQRLAEQGYIYLVSDKGYCYQPAQMEKPVVDLVGHFMNNPMPLKELPSTTASRRANGLIVGLLRSIPLKNLLLSSTGPTQPPKGSAA